jgi:hypothetical protein
MRAIATPRLLLYAQGIYGTVLADPYNDLHGLDRYNYVDGIGCEC